MYICRSSYGESENVTTASPVTPSEASIETSESEPILVMYPEARAAYWINHILVNIATPSLGLSGNLLSIILLMRPRLRDFPTSFFMVVLAVLDSGTLLFGTITIHIVPPVPWVCKVTFFLRRLCGESSGWILACMSVERCLAIAMPLRSRMIISSKVNKICTIAVLLSVTACYSYIFVYISSEGDQCFQKPNNVTKWLHIMVDYALLITSASESIWQQRKCT